MKCNLCQGFFTENIHSPVCPHPLTTREPAPGGPVLRPIIKQDIDEAFQTRDREKLRLWTVGPNFAAGYYAGLLLKQLDEQDTKEVINE